MRTRLLRSLARGKPFQVPSNPAAIRSGQTQMTANPAITYNAFTFGIINHIHATFGTSLNRRIPRLIHGADDVGVATMSDPATGKVNSQWGRTDISHQAQFFELFPGVAQYGLGAGEVVGCPNVMDVSQAHGMIYGLGYLEGFCYYRATDEERGRYIAPTQDFSMPAIGIPKLGTIGGATCCVWLAKNNVIPSLSEGLVGILIGSAAGVVTACSLGTDGLRGSRLKRGELTARWILSPGVPIVAIAIDDHYSLKRQAQNRIWAVALNALGELFYLTKFPARSTATMDVPVESKTEYLAWITGRSVYWNVVEPSRRTARPNPYNDAEIDGSYSPRSSWEGMCLSKDQVRAETEEIQRFLAKTPKDFRKLCLGWDMRRRLEVDFAGDDGNYAGEALVVFDCGTQDDSVSDVKRYTRFKLDQKASEISGVSSPAVSLPQQGSLFGGSCASDIPNGYSGPRTRTLSYASVGSSPERSDLVQEWRCSKFTFGAFKPVELTTTTLDQSTFASLTLSEDPALGFSGPSTASSPYASPLSVASQPASPADVPGQRARFMAAGTMTGDIFIWDIRAPISRSSDFVNSVDPIRVIHTDSPEISCLAMTGLQLVHGGNDGLVQAWDPLASSIQPIRTINSRFSFRARRHLAQAQASAQGVGINLYAAGAICLDPDPTVLRGAVSLGTQIRFWSYSSSAADRYKSSKRRLRRSERGSNNGGERVLRASRVTLKDYIANEKYEIEREQERQQRRAERLAGRFGIDLLGNEDEALAYATLLSQESLELEEQKRRERERESAVESGSGSVTTEGSVSGLGVVDEEGDMDDDLKAAIMLSLQENGSTALEAGFYDQGASGSGSGFEIPIKYTNGRKSSRGSGRGSPKMAGIEPGSSSAVNELDDLDFAIQLSLAEERSRREGLGEVDEFPPLSPSPGGRGKGKGKGKKVAW